MTEQAAAPESASAEAASPVSSFAATPVRAAAEERLRAKLTATPVGFDPVLITTMISTILDLLAKFCGGSDTPAQAIAGQYRQMDAWERAAMKNKLRARLRQEGYRGAKLREAVDYGVQSCEQVAAEAKPEERTAFIGDVMPIAVDDFDIF